MILNSPPDTIGQDSRRSLRCRNPRDTTFRAISIRRRSSSSIRTPTVLQVSGRSSGSQTQGRLESDVALPRALTSVGLRAQKEERANHKHPAECKNEDFLNHFRFRHRWRRPSRLSAAVPSSVAAPAAASSLSTASNCTLAAASAALCAKSIDRRCRSLPEEDTNFGRESLSVSPSPHFLLDSLESSHESLGSPVLKTPNENDSFQFLSECISILVL